MTTDTKLLAEYVQELQKRPAAETSVFWAKQLETFRAALAAGAEPQALSRVLGYGFDAPEDAPDGTVDDALALFEQARRKALDPLGKIRRKAGKARWEHARAITFLRKAGVLDDYRAEIADLGVASSMSTARHWWYARHLDQLAPSGPLDVLEIGAGAGNLSVLLGRRGRVRSYTIVDLPEMLLSAAATVASFVPDATAGFGPGAGTTYRFVRSDEAKALAPGSFDLACNFNSFMEMDRDQRDGYIELIYRCARPGALFVNVNRRQASLPLPDGSTWDNNPLLYPYRTDDEILEWEDDPFQTMERSELMSRPSLAVLRSARIAG